MNFENQLSWLSLGLAIGFTIGGHLVLLLVGF